MKTSRTLLVPVILSFAMASAQQAVVTESDRYFELASNTLNEPCLTYNGVSYAAKFVLDDRGEDGHYWALISGAELLAIPENCETVKQSVLTNDPSIDFVSYDMENLTIAEGEVDTGLRYDIGSRADTSRFDLGFSLDSIRERREEERVIVSGAGSASFSGPSSFPFELGEQANQWIGVDKSFSGTLNYDAQANMFTVTFDSSNAAGDYTLTVIFNTLGRSSSLGLVLVYPIEFHII